MKSIKEFIELSVEEYFTSVYAPRHNVKLKITQSWANYTEKNQYHHKHAHPNSFISGVFYVNADRSTDKIYFYKDGYQQIKIPTENYNQFNSESWWFETGTCDLILFPSSLIHMVVPVQSEKTRISLSFNTFPTGHIGEDDDLTALRIDTVDIIPHNR